MSLFLLDTDHASLLLGGHPLVGHRVAAVGAQVAISLVTVQELFNGWVVRINGAREMDEVVRLYGKLNRTLLLCKRIRVIEFDQSVAVVLQQLIVDNPELGKQRLKQDMRIAATALAHGAVMVTRNARDFSRVPGLTVEDWTF
jgi:tRNA(fMet)-specific endonuclease VapC